MAGNKSSSTGAEGRIGETLLMSDDKHRRAAAHLQRAGSEQTVTGQHVWMASCKNTMFSQHTGGLHILKQHSAQDGHYCLRVAGVLNDAGVLLHMCELATV
jgi:diacylglycerol kinase family enzyme